MSTKGPKVRRAAQARLTQQARRAQGRRLTRPRRAHAAGVGPAQAEVGAGCCVSPAGSRCDPYGAPQPALLRWPSAGHGQHRRADRHAEGRGEPWSSASRPATARAQGVADAGGSWPAASSPCRTPGRARPARRARRPRSCTAPPRSRGPARRAVTGEQRVDEQQRQRAARSRAAAATRARRSWPIRCRQVGGRRCRPPRCRRRAWRARGRPRRGDRRSVASTVAPVWVPPKSIPIESWASAEDHERDR